MLYEKFHINKFHSNKMENTFNFPDILEENSLQIPEQNYSSEETNESTNIKGIKICLILMIPQILN